MVKPLPGRLLGDGTDNIVGLVAVELQHRHVEGPHNIFDDRNGGADVLGLRFTVGFVGFVALVAKGGHAGIEGHGDVGRLFLGDHLEQGVGEAQGRAGVFALRIDARILAKGKVRPVDQRHRIEQKQFLSRLTHSRQR